MQLENWDDLKFVLAMHRHGTMSAAARYLNTNVATVSRRIERLSVELGQPLFEKRGQVLIATHVAEGLAKIAETIDHQLRTGTSALLSADPNALISFEVAAPPSVHARFLFPRISDLAIDHPNVRLSLTEKVFAQGLGEADIQIRIGRPDGGRLMARKFRDYSLRIYHGADHVLQGDWIGHSQRYPDGDALRTIYPDANPVPRFRVEEMTLVHQLVCMTGLPGLLPDFMVTPGDGLVLADLPGNHLPSELWITYHETRQGDPVLRAVVDWICQRDTDEPAS